MHDAFVSYASSDRTVAEAVRSKLQDAELGCWMAPHDIVAGTTWAEAIIEGVQASRSMVVVFSSRSNASSQVMREVDRAVAHKLPLVTFRIEDCRPTRAMEYFLSAQHWLDAFPEPGESHLAALADAVRRIASGRGRSRGGGARGFCSRRPRRATPRRQPTSACKRSTAETARMPSGGFARLRRAAIRSPRPTSGSTPWGKTTRVRRGGG